MGFLAEGWSCFSECEVYCGSRSTRHLPSTELIASKIEPTKNTQSVLEQVKERLQRSLESVRRKPPFLGRLVVVAATSHVTCMHGTFRPNHIQRC